MLLAKGSQSLYIVISTMYAGAFCVASLKAESFL